MNSSDTLPSPRHEQTTGSPRLVVLSAAGLAAGVAVVLLVAAWVLQHHDPTRALASRTGPELSFTQGPRQRTGIARDWIVQDAAVREHLATYGWNDRAAGVARIPIARAIELVSRDAANKTRKAAP